MTSSPGQTPCPRNLPQHFNGCTCTPAASMTAEVTVDLLVGDREWPNRLVTSAEMGLTAEPDLEFVTDEGADVVIVPPDDGDGETFYWEAQLNGHIWDGRGENLEEAKSEARSASTRMADLEPLDDEDDWEN